MTHDATVHSAPDCRVCPVQTCMARAPETASTWKSIVTQHPALLPNCKPLVAAGDAPKGLFTVRAGCVKSYTLDAHGNERVRGFYFPGDLIGLEAIGQAQAPAGFAAVVPSQVCAAAMRDVQTHVTTSIGFSNRLLDQARRELSMALSLAGEYSADQRVAAFLLHLNDRIGSEGVVRVPMTRREMGSYLRLATETVCRVITRFEQKGWLASQDKKITLFDLAALREIANPVGLEESRNAA
jgi:CRP/FNR family transcriptional regulator